MVSYALASILPVAAFRESSVELISALVSASPHHSHLNSQLCPSRSSSAWSVSVLSNCYDRAKGKKTWSKGGILYSICMYDRRYPKVTKLHGNKNRDIPKDCEHGESVYLWLWLLGGGVCGVPTIRKLRRERCRITRWFSNYVVCRNVFLMLRWTKKSPLFAEFLILIRNESEIQGKKERSRIKVMVRQDTVVRNSTKPRKLIRIGNSYNNLAVYTGEYLGHMHHTVKQCW